MEKKFFKQNFMLNLISFRLSTIDKRRHFHTIVMQQISQLKNLSVPIDPYDLESPVECYKLQILGVFCILLTLAGIVFNSILLYVCACKKDMRKSINSFMIAITVLNLFGCIFEMPFIIVSNFKCRYVFSNTNIKLCS